jgi:APA family basic amino acid/polyamine antiporter
LRRIFRPSYNLFTFIEKLAVSSSPLFRRKPFGLILKDTDEGVAGNEGLKRSLNVFDLTGLGIAAVIGAGIFSTIGTAAVSGGPAVSVLFLFTAVACAFSALCYAQFASVIPVSGSAYTYAYASFGELIAWIIGWDLIMEYAIGNIAVAISWSEYFSGLAGGIGIHIPEYLLVDYLSAARGYHAALSQMAAGASLTDLTSPLQEAYNAWLTAPHLGTIRLIADIPAFSIVVFITVLVYIGIYETKVAANTMVLLKVLTLILVISVGAFYIDPKNWSPFAPNGLTGVLKGVSGVFFAYIGFDAISTTAEECRNPRRDLPRSIILALLITTVLYILISLVLTGMVQSSELGVGDPLAYAFQKLHLTKLSGVIAIGAVIAMAGVLLVFQVGQPRIWMSMSRDGLLPKAFSRIHKKFRTPAFATVITGIVVAIPSLFMNITEVTDLCSIGTLFAFVLVSGGVLILDRRDTPDNSFKQGFRVPYLNSRYFLPAIWLIIFIVWAYSNYRETGFLMPDARWQVTVHDIPLAIFAIVAVILTFFAIRKKLSLIPVLGLLTNLYLMAYLGITNWMRFGIWLVIGLVIYFGYSVRKSKLREEDRQIIRSSDHQIKR